MRFSYERLKMAREKRGYTQSYVAKSIGIQASTLSDYEKGNAFPSIETLIDLANMLNIALDFFYVKDNE